MLKGVPIWFRNAFFVEIELNMEDAIVRKEKKSFDFIDSIRGLAMFGIVFEHTSAFWLIKYTEQSDRYIQAGYMQLAKFVTIIFFLISGFLINYKFTEYTPLQYLKNRFKNTIWPWLFWIAIFILLNNAQKIFLYLRFDRSDALPSSLYEATLGQFFSLVFYSNYWFILNFLICIAILLIFKRYLYKIGFGIILGLISLTYSVNLYSGWFPAEHTTALFGFVVYLWLGVYFNRYYDKVSAFLNKVPMLVLVVAAVVFFFLSTFETVNLMERGVADPYNTLRVTNIIYSLIFFGILLKMGPMKSVQKILQPRKTTYGIYLIHAIIIERVLAEIVRPFNISLANMSPAEAIVYSIVRFVIVYGIVVLITKLILKTKFKWSIGAKD